MAKKKKKKPQKGATRPTYAKGKMAQGPPQKSGAVALKEKKVTAAEKEKTERGDSGARPPGQQWNLIRKGTAELKVFELLLAIIVIVALLQYPLWTDVVNKQYKDLKKQYPKELKKWEQKYPTKAEQKKHEREKPVMPKKPTFKDFLIYQAFILVLQGALFAFIGLNIARRTDLSTPILDGIADKELAATDIRDLVVVSIPVGLVVLVPLVVSSFIGRYVGISKAVKMEYAAWKYCLYFINVSIQQQMLFVLLILSALVWLFSRYRDRIKIEPHWAALAAAFALSFLYCFYVGRSGGKMIVDVQWAFFQTLAVVGMLGYLYWKKGLEYSLLAGAIGFGIYPFLATFIVK